MSKRKLPLVGNTDAFALATIGAGALLSSPFFMGFPLSAALVVAPPALAGFWLNWRNLKGNLDKVNLDKKEDFVLPSDATFGEFIGSKGMRLGYTKDRNLPLDISNNILQRHMCIVGSSGVGKTTLGEYLMWQQTIRQAGYLMIDAKIDPDTRDRLNYMMHLAGRPDEFYVLNVDDPENSNTYNPLIAGDADEKASRLLNLLPSSENNPGSDFYRQSANHALTVIFGALDAAGYRYHFGDLSIMLQSGEALSQLERICPPGEQRMSLQVFLDQFRKKTKDGVVLDTDRLKQVLGGMSGRIAQFAQGKFGRVCNTYAPEIELTDIIKSGKCVYVCLPTMSKDTAALNLGKMILSDLRTAVYNIQSLPKPERPNPPFLVFADEFGAYTMQGVSRIFEQSRAANIIMTIALQSLSQLNQVSPDFSDMIIQNCWTKVCFKFGSKDSPDMISEIIGKQKVYIYGLSKGESESSSSQNLRVTPAGSDSGGGSVGESWREGEDFRVSPDRLKSLDMGQAIVMSGARVYHIRTPMLDYPKIPNYVVSRHPVKIPQGIKTLNFIERYKEFLMVGDGNPVLDKVVKKANLEDESIINSGPLPEGIIQSPISEDENPPLI